jgi:ABC-type multidrug transport system fused ATPase/permease subunit
LVFIVAPWLDLHDYCAARNYVGSRKLSSPGTHGEVSASARNATAPETRRPPLIEAHGITFGYGREAVLQDVDLAIRRDAFLAIPGPNGGGRLTSRYPTEYSASQS